MHIQEEPSINESLPPVPCTELGQFLEEKGETTFENLRVFYKEKIEETSEKLNKLLKDVPTPKEDSSHFTPFSARTSLLCNKLIHQTYRATRNEKDVLRDIVEQDVMPLIISAALNQPSEVREEKGYPAMVFAKAVEYLSIVCTLDSKIDLDSILNNYVGKNPDVFASTDVNIQDMRKALNSFKTQESPESYR